MALAIKIDVPWSETNRPHAWRLTLVDADGSPVVVDSAEGPRAIEVGDGFEVGRPAGLPEGTPIDLPLAINVAPFRPGHPALRTGDSRWTAPGRDDWQVRFLTRPSPTDTRTRADPTT